MKLLITLIICIFLCSSCVLSTAYINPLIDMPNQRTMSEQVIILAGDIAQPYTILGECTISAPKSGLALKKAIQKEVAKYGADAIIQVGLDNFNTYSIRTSVSGTLIKFENK